MPKSDPTSPWSAHVRAMKANPPKLHYAGQDVGPWQRKLRTRYAKLLGLDRMPKRPPQKAKRLWRREHKLGTIEKLRLACEPGLDIFAYLCTPNHAPKPWPVFICLQGHSTGMHVSIGLDSKEAKPEPSEGDRDFALGCLERGIAALCIEMRSFGQRVEKTVGQLHTHITCHTTAMNALMLGRTLQGERVYDVQCGVDYLATRDDMDLSRLGCMGNSGGGLITIASAAIDKRIQLAMPSCGFAPYSESIMKIHHCVDNFVPHMRLWAEMSDIAGLIAPRPLVFVAGKTDPLFPIQSVRRGFAETRRIYQAADAGDNAKLVVGNGGHRFYAEQGWKAMAKYM